jgi:hypothetical protein
MTTQARAKKYLKCIIKENPVTLMAEVAEEALEHDDIASFFSDLLSHGCQSGMVGKLIYYTDTHAFYDRYYDEIETLREEMETDFGEPLHPRGDLKNWYAWMAFEETARKMADSCGIEW